MAALAVVCRRCRAMVPTGIRTGWVHGPVMGDHEVPCARCGFRGSYHGADFRPAPAEALG